MVGHWTVNPKGTWFDSGHCTKSFTFAKCWSWFYSVYLKGLTFDRCSSSLASTDNYHNLHNNLHNLVPLSLTAAQKELTTGKQTTLLPISQQFGLPLNTNQTVKTKKQILRRFLFLIWYFLFLCFLVSLPPEWVSSHSRFSDSSKVWNKKYQASLWNIMQLRKPQNFQQIWVQ